MNLPAVLCAVLVLVLAATDVLSAAARNKEEGLAGDGVNNFDWVEVHSNLDPPLLPGRGECGIQNSVPGSGHAGSNQAELREFPWLVMLLDSSGNNCNGALISKRYVVTSASCSAEKTWARLGEHDATKAMDCATDPRDGETVCNRDVEITVQNITIHPDYNGTENPANDIALVRLSRDVEFTASIKPICLPAPRMNERSSYTNKRMWVSGWNQTRQGNAKKLKLPQKVVRVAECPGNNGSIHVLAECETCTGRHTEKPQRQVQQMYLGGQFVDVLVDEGPLEMRVAPLGEPELGNPLMWYDQADSRTEPRWTLVGVTSHHSTGCDESKFTMPVGFTRVSQYVPWILDKIHA